jgi:membrane protease YdiL (CAAX protease family)
MSTAPPSYTSPSLNGKSPTEPVPSSQPSVRLWIAPVALGAGLCGGVLASVLVYAIGSAFGSSTTNPTPAVSLIASLVFDLAFVGAALYFTVVRGRWRPADFGYRRAGWRLGVSAFVVGGVSYYVVTLVYAAALHLHGTDKLPTSFGVHRSTAAMLGTAAFVCVVAPICEEFFFRGFLFSVLSRMQVQLAGRELGPWVAALIVAVLFGIAHTGSVSSDQYLIPLAFLGFVLCVMRWRTGSLYPCMALHSFNNCLAMGVLLGWSLGEVAGLLAAAWAIIAAVTLPLSRLRAPVALQAG